MRGGIFLDRDDGYDGSLTNEKNGDINQEKPIASKSHQCNRTSQIVWIEYPLKISVERACHKKPKKAARNTSGCA